MAKELNPIPNGLKHYRYQVRCQMGITVYSVIARYSEHAIEEVTAFFMRDPSFQILNLAISMQYQDKEQQ